MAVNGGVLVLLLLLGYSCEAQQKIGFPAKTAQLLAGYLAKQGAPQVAGFQSGLGAPQAAGFQSGLGAPQAAGFQSGLGAPQAAGFQSELGAPQAAGFQSELGAPQSAGFQSGLGAPQSAGFQSGLGAPQAVGFQSGLGAPQAAGFQSRLGAPQAAGFQSGLGAPQAAGFQSGLGAPQAAGFQSGLGAPQAAGFQSGLGAPQAAGFQSGLGAPQAAGFQSGLGAPQAAGFQSGLFLTKQVALSLVKSVTGMQVNPDGVSVVCGEDSVVVLVQPILLGNGQPINASDITFGGCAPIGQDASGTVRFQSALQACGSTLMMTADALVYSFVLIYTPRGINGLPIVRTNGAMVGIECHYLRKQNVSSNALVPTWIPYYATMAAEAQLRFSLRLMDDAWQNERASNVYFLGNVLNIEASVLVGNSQPLRVFVDSCVATLVPDVSSVPSYAFVQNSGCLTDAKVTGSRSQFLPRKQDDKLQLQLDAFRFSQDGRSSMFITCSLRATVASVPVDSQHKACSFSLAANRWMSVDGNDQVCGCCDTSCGPAGVAGAQGTGVLGPIAIQQGPPMGSQPGQLHMLKG
ncbi:zona pellucida sperm-binding protein 3-like [Paramormyrops kingsleyae]|uniref:zona pellucida sperm-binding protein 3-like n=1 Tax=Paramormyrops kingsleyae TaxID=1676925 RepID=UPI003B974749